MNRPLHYVLLLILLCGAATLGFSAYRWHKPANDDGSAHAEPQPGLVMAAPGSGIPNQIPAFSLHDRDGKLRSIGEWKGKSLVINFWATWCPPCIAEMPLLKSIREQRLAQNFEVIGIAIDEHKNVAAYADKNGVKYPLLVGESDAYEVAEAFGPASMGLPFTVFADNQGRIVTLRLGELETKETNAILDAVAAINAGTLTLEQAKAQIRPSKVPRG